MIVIPARLNSTRLPRKVLLPVGGVPMVVATARRGLEVDRVVVATDSPEVIEVCQQYKIDAILTSPDHKSGTDRVNEAVELLGLGEEELIVNLQGDEPLIEPEVIERVLERLKNLKRSFKMVSCYKSIGFREVQDPHLVKVVVDRFGDALYFSRSPIPYHREGEGGQFFAHLGIYGFDRKSLRRFVQMEGWLEHLEKLEQLRVLENGEKIAMVEVESRGIGVDTWEDLELVRQLMEQKGQNGNK